MSNLDLVEIVDNLRRRIHKEEKEQLLKDNVIIPRYRATNFVRLWLDDTDHSPAYRRKYAKIFARTLRTEMEK